MHYDGWVLRFSSGFTKRANSVNPLYDSTLDPGDKIDRCEALYREMGLKTIFKMTDAASPEKLDEILEARGYYLNDPVSLQILELDNFRNTSPEDVDVSDRASDEWLKAYCAMDGRASANRATLEEMLGAIIPRAGYFALRKEGEIVACAMAVVDSGFAGLFNIIVDEAHRGGGLGERMMSGLLTWAGENSADAAYLQVLRSNAPAITLYKQLGFNEASRYWYRIKD
jgi:ribosomal protein S18 acetylase RimI-like enzyme